MKFESLEKIQNIINEENQLNLTIDPKDQMYIGDLNQYLYVGKTFLKFVRLVQLLSGEIKLNKILDFNSGYGRITRQLVAEFPDSEITTADYFQKSLDFCTKEFKSNQILLSGSPSNINIQDKYNLIFCNCYLTSLNETDWNVVIRSLYNALEHGGILLLSTHGKLSEQMILDFLSTNLDDKQAPYGLNRDYCQKLIQGINQIGYGYVGGREDYASLFLIGFLLALK